MLYLIIILGLILRLTFIDKTEGLWNDEYVSWFVANTPFSNGFFNAILKQCHMPLYYFYLKPFCHYPDIVLRLTSVIPSILAIPIMYFTGKIYSKKTGIYSALITSFLSFLIYYAQEVRFYSLLFLFSSLSIMFTIKYLKENSSKNLVGYILSNILILLTHVLGIIYVFFNFLYILYKKKKITKSIIITFLALTPIILFFGINILKMLPSSQWWGHFSYTNILFLFSDFLSPILTNHVNAPPVFFYNKNLAFLLLTPTLIASIGYFRGLKKELCINFIAFSVITIMSILAAFGKLVFITKYAIEILPIFILTIAIGFSELKKLGCLLISTFIALHIGTLFTPNYVTKIPRKEGNKIVAEILKDHNAENIVFTYYEPNRFERYIDLSNKKTFFISKSNRFEYIDNPSRIIDNIKNNETVSLVFLESVSFFNEQIVEQNRNNSAIPEMFITFSDIKNKLLKTFEKSFYDYNVTRAGDWLIITARKNNRNCVDK